jgi:hypothetical protein
MTLTSAAIALVRWWTQIYTWGMPAEARASRIAEIESDLWECRREHGASGATAMQILLRLVLGAVDDLVWRTTFDFATYPGRRQAWAFTAMFALVTLIAAAAWVASIVSASELPTPPRVMHFMPSPQPPPPPPPPLVQAR